MKIAWFGLGRFGMPMAMNLVRRGHAVFVSPAGGHALAAVEEAVTRGAHRLAPDDAVDCWATCLPRPEDVAEAVAGLESARTALVVDFSTGHPEAARTLAGQLGARGIGYVDAPVSGSVDAAGSGALTIWVGAPEPPAGDALAELLGDVGANVFYLGEVGLGVGMKLVNQVVHIGTMAAIGEGLTLARGLGIDPRVAVDSMRTSSADSAMLRRFGDSIVRDDFSPRFALWLALKDVRFAMRTAEAHGLALEVLPTIERRLDALAGHGHAERDFSLLAGKTVAVTESGDADPPPAA